MNKEPNVLLSARVYDRQVGGNTRYVHNVYSRIEQHGVGFQLARPANASGSGKLRSAQYAALEGIGWPLAPRPDATVLHFPADTGAVARGRLPIVGTIHGLATLHVPGVRGSASDALWRARVRRLARVSDQIITVSESSASDIAHFEPSAANRITVIHHGIDHDRFNPVPVDDWEQVRARLNLPAQFFFYAGNLDPRKNIVALCAAAQEVHAATGIPLVVSGSAAWDSADSLQAVEHTPGVIYLGRTSDTDMISLMQNALAFCFPSLYEGFGFPVLEAMACGAPVICSDRGSLREVAGDACLMISDVSATGIAEAMTELLADPRERESLTRSGFDHAANFRWQVSAEEHARVFKEVSN
ncbi:glycosyltransferase family 4 protein [Microbacterium sp. C23T]